MLLVSEHLCESAVAGLWPMDSKFYLEWRASLGMWVVEYHSDIRARFDTQAQAEQWVKAYYPRHGYEI